MDIIPVRTSFIRAADNEPGAAFVHSAATLVNGAKGEQVSIFDVPHRTARFGDCHHPIGFDRYFAVIAGEGWLYTSDPTKPEEGHRQMFGANELYCVKGGVAYAMVCEPGTMVVAITNWRLGPQNTFACHLEIGEQ